jgi:hypothetical protein
MVVCARSRRGMEYLVSDQRSFAGVNDVVMIERRYRERHVYCFVNYILHISLNIGRRSVLHLFQLALRKKSPAQVGLARPGNVVAKGFLDSQRLLGARRTFLVSSVFGCVRCLALRRRGLISHLQFPVLLQILGTRSRERSLWMRLASKSLAFMAIAPKQKWMSASRESRSG